MNTTPGTMSVCSACGSIEFRRVRAAEHEDTILGYPVTLHNGVDILSCGNCAHEVPLILDLPRLMASVAANRIMMSEKLNGRELQLIRKATGLKAIDVAQKLDVTPATLSRWENDKEPMRLETERAFRLCMLNLLSSRTHISRDHFAMLIDLEIVPLRPTKWQRMHFERIKVREADKEKAMQWETAEQPVAA